MTQPQIPDTDWTPWPDALANHYRATGVWHGHMLWDILAHQARARPDREALICGNRHWSYAQLDEAARRVAAGLWQRGIQAHDHVILQLPNRAEFFIACFALWRLGARPVMALPGHRAAEIRHFCQQTQAVACITADRDGTHDSLSMMQSIQQELPALRRLIVVPSQPRTAPYPEGIEHFDALLSQPALPMSQGHSAPQDLALLQVSGGSTGLPKLIPRTHDDYAYSIRVSAEVCLLTPDTRYLAVLPVAHNFPLSSPGALGVWHAGGTVVLSHQADPATVFSLIDSHGITMTAAVPPLVHAWLEARASCPASLKTWRVLQVGGAKLSAHIAQRIGPELGCQLQQVFGMAEGLVNYTRLDDPPELIAHTQGRPMSPLDEIRIVDDHDVDVAPGQSGHLLTRGPYTIRGYFRANAHNQKAFTPDGFYRTGDIARQLPSGHLVVEGRAKDQINRGGEKVAAEELENHLMAHPEIRDVAVIGIPDPDLGERTCAVIVTRGAPLSRQALVHFLRQRGLATFKFPDRYDYVDRLPKTSVGKVNKRALRDQFTRPQDLNA